MSTKKITQKGAHKLARRRLNRVKRNITTRNLQTRKESNPNQISPVLYRSRWDR